MVQMMHTGQSRAKRSLATAIASVLLACHSVTAQPAGDPDAEVIAGKRRLEGLRLQLLAPRAKYELGEPIVVIMRYTYSGKRKLRIVHLNYNRCGQFGDVSFSAVDSDGRPVRDPIAGAFTGSGGGLRGEGPLSSDQPYEHDECINQWVCFDEPGRYVVTAMSRVVRFDPSGTGSSHGPDIPLRSEPLSIEIVPPIDEHRVARLCAAREALKSEEPDRQRYAMRDLRCMVDLRAIPYLVEGLALTEFNASSEARFGLYSFRDMAPVMAELLKRADAPSRFLASHEIHHYRSLLVAAELDAMGLPRQPEKREHREIHSGIRQKWQKRLAREDFIERSISTLPPAEAAGAALYGLRSGSERLRSAPKPWEIVIAHAATTSPTHEREIASLIQYVCRVKEVVPALRKLAEDRSRGGALRTAALVALHRMGDDSCRDLIVEDIALPKPVLGRPAFETLQGYKSAVVGQRLLALFDLPYGQVRRDVATRLRDFGTGVPLPGLLSAMEQWECPRGYPQAPLLKLVAIKSPPAALPYLRRLMRDPYYADRAPHACEAELVLARLDLPGAQELILEALHSVEHSERAAMARALWESAQSARQRKEEEAALGHKRDRGFREVPPSFVVPASMLPEFLTLYRADRSGDARWAARQALAEITGVPEPKKRRRASQAQWDASLPRWEEWWHRNGAKYGRWSRTWSGLAMKCSTEKGEYQLGESIWLSARIHRVSGQTTVEPRVYLHGQFLAHDDPTDALGSCWDDSGIAASTQRGPGSGPDHKAGDETTLRVDIQSVIQRLREQEINRADREKEDGQDALARTRIRRVSPPCRVRFYAGCADDPKAAFQSLQSPPITIHFEEDKP